VGAPGARARRSVGRIVKDAGKRIVRASKVALLIVAGHLPARVGDAFVQSAVAGGGRPGSGLPGDAVLVVGVERVREIFDRGDVERARQLVDGLHAARPDSVRVLQLRKDVLQRQGELSELARTQHRLHTATRDGARLEFERRTLGRLTETSAGWLPRIPGPSRPVQPPDPSVVLHLLKESAPELTNGFTMRSRYNLISARDAGIRPVVVTSLGFPRSVGVDTFEQVEIVDDIPHHRLDLGPHYPETPPFDMVLEHQAWLTARIARRTRPAVIHVSSGRRGYETALVGLALRDHVRRPVVYEVRSFFEATWSGDERWNERAEHYRRRFATETRAMLASDHVITIAETMKADIIERGVPSDRITVIPNGVDADVFAPRPRDPGLAQRLGLDGTFVFGYISNLDHPRENQELLVVATAALQRRGRRVRCLIIGDGRRRAMLEHAARQAGVRDAVVFTGAVPHDTVQAYYALLDAFVVPRRDERASRNVTPLKPYEALAMERPLVVADLPALTEIVGRDRGLTFRADDAEALADSLERLMDDPALGQRLGRTGREWVRRDRSWAANGGRFGEVYREVLDRWVAVVPEVA
jgi:glycosyltransferase involved in cell wall biosynthesis